MLVGGGLTNTYHAFRALDAWSDENIRPWFRDHAEVDAAMLRRFAGHDVALEEHIPSDVVCAAAEGEPA